jgi:hypothetical protein
VPADDSDDDGATTGTVMSARELRAVMRDRSKRATAVA